jgi:TamB, inner membrane protein subunit of TAM complex
VAEVVVWLQGHGAQPAIDGRLNFDAKRPFTLVPRGTRRELTVGDGWLNLVDTVGGAGVSGDPCHPPKGDPNAQVGARRHYRVDLCGIAGSIDEEGHLKGINGSLELVDWKLVDGDITIQRAEQMPFRIPHELDVTLNADSLHLSSDAISHSWSLTGVVEVPGGKYTRNFDFSEFLKPQAAATGQGVPFWETYPALGAMALDLTLDVRKFSVDDNVATIDLAGQLLISGTPRDPRFDGTIQVGRGEFRLPASRAKFTRTTGSVTFSRLSRFPNETPSLAIESEADYRDPSGQTHLITLTIDGTLSQLNWNLFTSSGLNKAQTLTLILSGRTPEQFKRSLGNDAVGSDPTHIETSTNPNDSYADQLIKDVAADFISLLVEDSLKDVSKLDVARLEIGTGSVGFHGEKKLTDTINVLGDLEQTVRGSSVYVRGEWHAPYKFILQGGYLKKSFDDAAEEDVSDWEVKLVYRFFIP